MDRVIAEMKYGRVIEELKDGQRDWRIERWTEKSKNWKMERVIAELKNGQRDWRIEKWTERLKNWRMDRVIEELKDGQSIGHGHCKAGFEGLTKGSEMIFTD